jgi:hypothetical protein
MFLRNIGIHQRVYTAPKARTSTPSHCREYLKPYNVWQVIIKIHINKPIAKHMFKTGHDRFTHSLHFVVDDSLPAWSLDRHS